MRLFFTLLFLALTACQPGLNRQPRNGPLSPSTAFPNGMAARPLPEGVIPFRGREEHRSPAGLARLERGESRYNIHCAVCHGLDGEGGLAGERGFFGIPSLHSPRARAYTEEEIFRIIEDGWGRMAAMGNRLPREEASAISAYLKALQWSQHARLRDLPPADKSRFERSAP